MTNLPARIAGVVTLGIAVLLYDTASGAPLHRLVLPLVMALATWMMVQNAAAVLLGAALLAAIHSDTAAADWISSRAYPALAVLSAAGLGYIGLQRFRRRIAATREARWRHRQR